MGKVGSTTLELALPGSIHIHTLYDNRLWDESNNPFLKTKRLAGFALKRLAINSRRRVRIITLIREPQSRDVSMFFQLMPSLIHNYISENNYDSRGEGMELLYETFENAYDYNFALDWFDMELKRLTGIDVFDYPFDKNKGYLEINKGKYDVLLIEMAKLNDLEGVVGDFCSTNICFKDSNRGGLKWYGQIYKVFKKEYLPSEKYLNTLKNSKFYKHFYGDSNDT